MAQTVVNFERMWCDGATTGSIQEEFLAAARALFEDRAPESVYLRVLTSLFKDFVEEAGEETAERGKTGFYDSVVWNKLYKFQRDGVLGAIEKLERHNGCIIADSVGLGETFEALAVIKYYELRNDRVLVLAPKRLRENWTVYRGNDNRNPLAEDRFHYDVLNHTDLSRTSGLSGDIDLANTNWGNYDLVVIDESHNFRNNPQVKGRMTRYERLMNEVFKNGVKTKVLMLSATPVNTRLADLKNQVLFATEGDDQALATDGIKSIPSDPGQGAEALQRMAAHACGHPEHEVPGRNARHGLHPPAGPGHDRPLAQAHPEVLRHEGRRKVPRPTGPDQPHPAH
ncbi:DEAD/DEAH box helicase family protein [Streptomyces sp. NBC_00690]|uniref:DEAD/DEAH box helicase family protein n=1 Tax=Streptomyces sp. NBC_00690 TaxID=2975808 RepID=UPI002E294438|nr:SNF2-related protein [Streptomyces sp. NBC_00690]